MEKGSPIPVVITYYQDKSFTFEMKTPPVSFFLKKAANLQTGSQTPGRGIAGKRHAAPRCARSPTKKMKDLNADRRRGGDEDDRRLGPLDGPRGGGAKAMAKLAKRTARPARASTARSSTRSTRR